ncbi:MAG: SigB/SigF/SigG family RNA polymerase sigma factor [Clostridiales bacterium]|nr:SigB/SigF/SigG family RNA polymerase sigma factor [Clostridiales bacterium]
MLSDTETIKYLRLAKNGDNNSKEILIKNNVLLVKSIANRFRNKGVDYDDLFQLGSMGLLKAIYNFDESFCVKFSTYAVPMIIGEIKRFLRDDGEIKISRIIKYNAYKISQFSEEYQLKNGSEPTVHEISKNLSISLEDVVLALDSTKLTVSLYETTVDSEEKTQSLIDKIPSEDTEDSRIDSIYVKQLLSRLNEREKQVVTLRYFKDKTQGEVSKILGVSQVQVSRLESKIIKKLKTIAEKK